MVKDFILSFEEIMELGNYGLTVEDLKKRVNECNELNEIRYTQELASSNITKILSCMY